MGRTFGGCRKPLLNTNQPRAGRLAHVMNLNSHLRRSLRGRWARWQEKWSEHDGLVMKRPSIVEILESQLLTARPYSVSALQNFAACPYRFLLSAIYRLEPREEPAALEEMDPLTKGRLFHRIQAQLQRELEKCSFDRRVNGNIQEQQRMPGEVRPGADLFKRCLEK